MDNAYQPDIPLYHYIPGASDTQKIDAWTIRLLTAKQPEVESFGADIMLEWAVKDWPGLGFSFRGS